MADKPDVLNLLTVRPGGGRDYPIKIGTGLATCLAPEIQVLSSNCRVLLVSDKNVAKLYLAPVLKGLAASGIDVEQEIFPPGEKHKNFKGYQRLIRRLAKMDDARDLVVVALGGGVIGDMAGFAAATYRRGIPLVQVPTTLLACVDSSVGGKTAIDLPEGKNLLGSFYQPRAVIIDLHFLETLPGRELRAGLAEIIKYGFIMDARFTARLEKKIPLLLERDPAETAYAINKSCSLKARTVKQDERDSKGIRAILNFGHTFAHAIETACGYTKYRHGEAVAIGMVCAAELSAELGMMSKEDAARVEKLVEAAQLPTRIEGAATSDMLELMKRDKKTLAGNVRFILLKETGKAELKNDVPVKAVKKILDKRIQLKNSKV